MSKAGLNQSGSTLWTLGVVVCPQDPLQLFTSNLFYNIVQTAQSHLVDSQLGMHTATLTSDAEILLSNTRLFAQPRLDEQSQNKHSPLQLSLLDAKTSPWSSKNAGAAQEEAGLVSLASRESRSERRLERHCEDLSLGDEHGARTTPKVPSEQREHQRGPSQQSHTGEQLSAEELAAGCEY